MFNEYVNVFIVLCVILFTLCFFLYFYAFVIQPFGCSIINKVELIFVRKQRLTLFPALGTVSNSCVKKQSYTRQLPSSWFMAPCPYTWSVGKVVMSVAVGHLVFSEQWTAVREESRRDGLFRWTRPSCRWSKRSARCSIRGGLQLESEFHVILSCY